MSAATGSSRGATLVLTHRELVRFARQPSRIIATVITTVLMWVLLASGFAQSFAGGSYGAFLVPGIATMVVVFSAIFSAMSLIEDRNEGFLQGVLVSPSPLRAVIGSKAIGGAIIATGQAGVLLVIGWAIGPVHDVLGLIAALGALACVGVGVTGLGLGLAWKVNSSAGFHGVMNTILLPMWLLSGSVFPIDGAATWLSVLMRINPLSWATLAMRQGLAGQTPDAWVWLGTLAVALGGVGIAWAMMSKTRRADAG